MRPSFAPRHHHDIKLQPSKPDAAIGTDVTERLGTVKQEQSIPAGFRSEVEPRSGQTIRFDIYLGEPNQGEYASWERTLELL